MIGEDDEGRQIFVFTAEGVGDPRARAGESGETETCRLQERALTVHSGLPDDIVNEGDLIDDLAERRNDVAQHLAAFPVGLESPGTGEAGPGGALEKLDRLARIPRLAVLLREQRLVVKGINMARRPCHKKLDDPFCFWWRVEGSRENPARGESVPREEIGERKAGKGPGESAEKMATLEKSRFALRVVHVTVIGVHG